MHEEKGIAVRQNALDGGVVEREREVHQTVNYTFRAALADDIAIPAPAYPANIREIVTTLFQLGREVTSTLDLDDLLRKIPELIARLTTFHAFAVYLLDEPAQELWVAYSVGYPPARVRMRLKVGQGLVGAAVAQGAPLVANDVAADSRYVEAVPGSKAELVVPLRRKGRVIGALNLLSDTAGQFTE
ncbi:MAG: hypothetical protein DMF90_02470, partial [Acidobacteria bacterium]